MDSFASVRGRLSRLFILILLAAGCNPYPNQKGEFNAGPVDAANFALPYNGTGADNTVYGYLAGRGTFTEIRAYIGNAAAGYYSFPFTSAQLAEQDPLVVYGDPTLKKPYTPNAYVFDSAPPNPFPSPAKCTPPRDYTYNEELDDMRLDEQSNIFTLLPIATERPGEASSFDYIPVVAEVAVSATGRNCQSLKSERTLKTVLGTPPSTGNFLLWAIIDPAAGVYRVGQVSSPYTLSDGSRNPFYSRGQDTQKWGWFGQYYLAYIDGGYVPTQLVSVTVGSGSSRRQIQTPKMATQKLYIPLRITTAGVRCGSATCQAGQVCANNICKSCNANRATPSDDCPAGLTCCPSPQTCSNPGASGTCADVGTVGQGYDVLQSRRSDANYSPVCAVYVYDANTSSAPTRPLAISELPRSEAGILALTNPNPRTTSGSGRLIYCPQVD